MITRSGHRLCAAVVLCLCLGTPAHAQEPSVPRQPVDSVFRFFTAHPSPKRAALYSALVPGLGQVYNKQYWKTGVVYAGMGVIAGFMVSNVRQYRFYHKVYIGRIDADPATTDTLVQYSNDDINTLRKGYRTYTEYTAIAGTLAYLLNMLDAYVSAHLKTFDMSRDISFHAMPILNQQRQPALRVTLALK